MLPALLRANLHTRQYADLVGRVLRRLAPAGGVADSDLTSLWDLAQKARLARASLPLSQLCAWPTTLKRCCSAGT